MVEHGNNIFEMTHSIFSLLFAVFEVLSFCMADLRRWNPTRSNGPTWWPDSRQPPALTSWRSPRQQHLPQQLPRQLQRLLGRRMLGTWGLQQWIKKPSLGWWIRKPGNHMFFPLKLIVVSDKCQAAKAPVQAAAEPPAPIAPTTMVDRTARHVWWPFGAKKTHWHTHMLERCALKLEADNKSHQTLSCRWAADAQLMHFVGSQTHWLTTTH